MPEIKKATRNVMGGFSTKKTVPIFPINPSETIKKDNLNIVTPMVKPIGVIEEILQNKDKVNFSPPSLPIEKKDNVMVSSHPLTKNYHYLVDSDSPISAKYNQPKQNNIANVFDDVGTQLLNSVQTFGGSIIGDAINMVSPSAADIVEKYTAGVIPHTSQQQFESNRGDNEYAWNNRISNTANAASTAIVGELFGAGMNWGANKIASGELKNKIIERFPIFIKSENSLSRGIGKGRVGLDDLSESGRNLIKPISKVVDKGDDVVNPIVNQLDEPPLEIVFDDMLPNRSSINLDRGASYTKTKKQIPYDKIDLGNDLVLYNNASRQVSDESILGTHRAIKSIKNSKTNEYIDLKSWKDGDNLYYYFSANMPSSKIKAGKAYLELEKHIPTGSTILENSSLSMDSFNNILKQIKNPKFESSVKGKINLNNMSIHNTVPFSEKKSAFTTTDRILFKTKEDANMSVIELNKLLKSNNLPEASVIEHTISNSFLDSSEKLIQDKLLKNKIRYGIELPNIALKKLYTILGITSTGVATQSQNQNKNEQ